MGGPAASPFGRRLKPPLRGFALPMLRSGDLQSPCEATRRMGGPAAISLRGAVETAAPGASRFPCHGAAIFSRRAKRRGAWAGQRPSPFGRRLKPPLRALRASHATERRSSVAVRSDAAHGRASGLSLRGAVETAAPGASRFPCHGAAIFSRRAKRATFRPLIFSADMLCHGQSRAFRWNSYRHSVESVGRITRPPHGTITTGVPFFTSL